MCSSDLTDISYTVPQADKLTAEPGETVLRIDPTKSKVGYSIEEKIFGIGANTAKATTNGIAGDLAVNVAEGGPAHGEHHISRSVGEGRALPHGGHDLGRDLATGDRAGIVLDAEPAVAGADPEQATSRDKNHEQDGEPDQDTAHAGQPQVSVCPVQS